MPILLSISNLQNSHENRWNIHKLSSQGQKVRWRKIYQFSQWKYPGLYQKEQLVSWFLWPQYTWLCSLGHDEKDGLQECKVKTSKGFQQRYQMHEIYWQKKSISSSIDQWWMQLKEVVEEGGGPSEHLIRLIGSWFYINLYSCWYVIINRKLNMIK